MLLDKVATYKEKTEPSEEINKAQFPPAGCSRSPVIVTRSCLLF